VREPAFATAAARLNNDWWIRSSRCVLVTVVAGSLTRNSSDVTAAAAAAVGVIPLLLFSDRGRLGSIPVCFMLKNLG
jgi:hypothetical protein